MMGHHCSTNEGGFVGAACCPLPVEKCSGAKKGDTAAIVTENQRSEQAGQPTGKAGLSGQEPADLAIALENVNADSLGEGAASGKPSLQDGVGSRPRITASGRGAVAEQILQIAFDRGIKVRKDGDLAEILAAVEVESEIPLAALAGVAEILRYLYQTDKATGPAAEQTDRAAAPPLEENRS